VITKDGQVVSHQDQSQIATIESIPWLQDIYRKVSGTDVVKINGKKMIICYDTSPITGWISVIVIPPDRLLDKILPSLRMYTVYVAIILILISIIISYFITVRITRPIQKLTKATKKIGEGIFDIKIQEEGSSEFKELIHKFNGMNDKIQKLIEENYESKIKEKEAEITALNLQLDPHFMYNTLNLINLISTENGQDEISEMIMSLSTMLKYTVKNQKDIVPFKEDFEYLKGYIYLMTKRFEGKFTVEYDVEEKLNNYSAPKFLMQPFVENSLVHGFNSIKKGGILRIHCWIEEMNRYFCIEDNGNGMSEEKILELSCPETGSVGMNNVDKRIKIIYGDTYGIKIESELGSFTRVIIKLPLEKGELII
jgi:two-component system sensor histidine kinase YesM